MVRWPATQQLLFMLHHFTSRIFLWHSRTPAHAHAPTSSTAKADLQIYSSLNDTIEISASVARRLFSRSRNYSLVYSAILRLFRHMLVVFCFFSLTVFLCSLRLFRDCVISARFLLLSAFIVVYLFIYFLLFGYVF